MLPFNFSHFQGRAEFPELLLVTDTELGTGCLEDVSVYVGNCVQKDYSVPSDEKV